MGNLYIVCVLFVNELFGRGVVCYMLLVNMNISSVFDVLFCVVMKVVVFVEFEFGLEV